MFYFIENGNGDVCVVDCVRGVVVVVDGFGDFWFKYNGNFMIYMNLS